MAEPSSALSHFHEAVASLRKEGTKDDETQTLGPEDAQAFIDGLLPHCADLFTDDTTDAVQRVCDTLSVAGISLRSLMELDNPRKQLYVLYIRAFQSVHPRRYVREFVTAIEQRLTSGPVDLERINPLWCDTAHSFYMHCWRRITSSSAAPAQTNLKRDATVGRAVFTQLLGAVVKQSGAPTSIQGPLEQFKKHDTSMALVKRLMEFAKKNNNNELIEKSMAHAKLCMHSVDKARLARECINLAQKHGINPQERLMQLSTLMSGGKGKRMRRRQR